MTWPKTLSAGSLSDEKSAARARKMFAREDEQETNYREKVECPTCGKFITIKQSDRHNGYCSDRCENK